MTTMQPPRDPPFAYGRLHLRAFLVWCEERGVSGRDCTKLLAPSPRDAVLEWVASEAGLTDGGPVTVDVMGSDGEHRWFAVASAGEKVAAIEKKARGAKPFGEE